MKKRRVVELGMAVLLLASAFLLSREGARLVSKEAEGKKGVIVVDAGHGSGGHKETGGKGDQPENIEKAPEASGKRRVSGDHDQI